MIKQLKSRYDDKSKYRRIILGVDKARMTVYEVDQSAEAGMDLNPEEKLYEKRGNKFQEKSLFDKTKAGGFKFDE